MAKNQQTAKNIDYGKEMLKATKAGDIEKVRTLLSMDAGLINVKDKDDSTPLHCASWKGYREMVELLLDHGADINAKNNNDHWGDTPLHAAAHGNQKEVAELLIARGADIHARNLNNRTPLAETIPHDARPVAKLLKQHGAIEEEK